MNSVFGTRVAVLAGDYLFAQSSWYLANLDNLEVIKLISQARLRPFCGAILAIRSNAARSWRSCSLLRAPTSYR